MAKSNKNLSPFVTEVFLRGRKLKFHLLLYQNLISKWIKL